MKAISSQTWQVCFPTHTPQPGCAHLCFKTRKKKKLLWGGGQDAWVRRKKIFVVAKHGNPRASAKFQHLNRDAVFDKRAANYFWRHSAPQMNSCCARCPSQAERHQTVIVVTARVKRPTCLFVSDNGDAWWHFLLLEPRPCHSP